MKMYWFSFAKHGHDLEYRRNRLSNIARSTEDDNLYNECMAEIAKLDEVLRYSNGGAAQIPVDLYGTAMNAVNWACSARAGACVAAGRYDLLQYC